VSQALGLSIRSFIRSGLFVSALAFAEWQLYLHLKAGASVRGSERLMLNRLNTRDALCRRI
jgi:hypothetical protein